MSVVSGQLSVAKRQKTAAFAEATARQGGQRTDDRNQSVKKKEEEDSPVGAAFSRDLALLTT